MKIGMVTQWYDPETGSAAIPGSVSRALVALGHEVTVVTGFPNYPTGKLYAGYKMRPLAREQRDGVAVRRIPMYPAHGNSGVRRAAFFVSFMASASSIGAALLRRSDAILVYSTSSTVGVAGVVLKRLLRRPVVLLVEDLWPDSVIASGLVGDTGAKIAWRSLAWLSKVGYDAADRLAVISPGLRDVLISRGVEPEKVDLVYNWVDESVFRPEPTTASEVTFDVMYAGNLGDVQGIEVAIQALALLADRPEIRLRLVGGGVAEKGLRQLVNELALGDRVLFEGPKPLSEMAVLMADAHAQLICLKDLPLFRATMPSKTQAILACGRPVVVSAPGDVAALVEASGAGEAVPPEDPKLLADALRRMADRSPEEREGLGRAGRAFYEADLCADVGSRRLVQSLETAALGSS